MKHRAVLFILLVPAVYVVRRVAADQYWLRHNRIWDDGWTSAWECAAGHMRAYEDTPERYIAEHGFWWRTEAENA